jgi:hypothetical protein
MPLAGEHGRSERAHCRMAGERQGVAFTRNAFTIDTVRMRMYAPIIPGNTEIGKNFGVRCMIIWRSPRGTYSLKHD